jgi:hypothetical protein
MHVIRILVTLIAFTLPCSAQGSKSMSFIRHVGDYSFRIPSANFFYQLHMQFCANAEGDTCKDNLGFLQRSWIALDSALQAQERERARDPMAYLDIDYLSQLYAVYNEQTTHFVETEGESVTPDSMRPHELEN